MTRPDIQSPRQPWGSTGRHSLFTDPERLLEESEIDEASLVARGEGAPAGSVEQMQAQKLLARRGGTRGAAILRSIVANPGGDEAVRATGASILAEAEGAQSQLTQLLDVRDELVLLKVLRGLAQVGDPDAFWALARIPERRSPFIDRELRFARALIAYRNDLRNDPLATVEIPDERLPSGEGLEVAARSLDPTELEERLNRVEGSLYGIEVSSEFGFELQAGRARWLALVEKNLAEQTYRNTGERKCLLALLARWMSETDTYSVQYIVLTTPVSDDDIRVFVLRSDGELVHAGRGSLNEGVLNFSLSSLEREGVAPAMISGGLGAAEIDLRDVFISAKGGAKRLAPPAGPPPRA